MQEKANVDLIELSAPQLGDAEIEAVADVIRSKWLAQGAVVEQFESEFARLHGHTSAVAVSSCTAGLHLALAASGIGPGDEVLVPSMSFVATANCVLYCGAKPVFVDIQDTRTPHICLEDASRKCGKRTKAVIVMHYGGFAVDMARWREFADRRNLVLVEDAAHAPGIDSVGHLGDVCVYSFFSNKNVTTAEGGMIVSRDKGMLDRIRLLRSHGMTSGTLDRHKGHAFSYDVVDLGWNYRLDELRAALGLVQIENLQVWNTERMALRRAYQKHLSGQGFSLEIPFEGIAVGAAHLMPVILPSGTQRADVMDSLRSNRIQSSIHYPPIHRFSFYESRLGRVALPKTDEFADRVLTLPLHPGLSREDVDRVCVCLIGALSKVKSAHARCAE